MPIEIRELVIKATVTQDGAAGNKGTGSAGSGGGASKASEEVINACVEKILEILKDKHER